MLSTLGKWLTGIRVYLFIVDNFRLGSIEQVFYFFKCPLNFSATFLQSVRAAHVGNVISFHAKRNRIVKRYKGKGKQKIYGKYQSKTYEAKYKIAKVQKKSSHTRTHTHSHTYSRICVGIKGWVVFMSGKYVSGSALIRFMTEPRSSVTVCVRVQLCLCACVCVCCRHIVEQLFFNFCLAIFLMAAFFKMNGFVHKFSLYA